MFTEQFFVRVRKESEAIYREWSKAVKASGIGLSAIMKVEETFANHLSNAMAERLNGKNQLLKSIGRGYRKARKLPKCNALFLRQT